MKTWCAVKFRWHRTKGDTAVLWILIHRFLKMSPIHLLQIQYVAPNDETLKNTMTKLWMKLWVSTVTVNSINSINSIIFIKEVRHEAPCMWSHIKESWLLQVQSLDLNRGVELTRQAWSRCAGGRGNQVIGNERQPWRNRVARDKRQRAHVSTVNTMSRSVNNLGHSSSINT